MKTLRHQCKNVWGECIMTAPNVKLPLKTGVLKKKHQNPNKWAKNTKLPVSYAHTCTHTLPPIDPQFHAGNYGAAG